MGLAVVRSVQLRDEVVFQCARAVAVEDYGERQEQGHQKARRVKLEPGVEEVHRPEFSESSEAQVQQVDDVDGRCRGEEYLMGDRMVDLISNLGLTILGSLC